MTTTAYRRILVPLDGSAAAEAILPFAERIAGPLDAEVLLLRVVEPLSAGEAMAVGGVVAPEALQLRESEARQYVAQVQRQLSERGLRVRGTVCLGTPTEAIVTTVVREDVDLVAMGTHGRGSLGRVVFGSVAEAVLRAAPVPVLMMRMAARTTAAPLEHSRR